MNSFIFFTHTYVCVCVYILTKQCHTHRATTKNWSICRSVSGLFGSQTFTSNFDCSLSSDSPVQEQRKRSLVIHKAHTLPHMIDDCGHHDIKTVPKPMSIESVMTSNILILCHPLLFLPSIFPSIRVFSNESAFCIGSQSIGVAASTSVLPMNTQD